MSKSKLTLIIDGNWLLMSRLSVVMDKYSSDNELKNNLKLLMIRSIKLVLKQFPMIDNIIFVSDGGSWRNSITIPKFFNHDELGKDVEYKGKRVKLDNIDFIFSIYDEFIVDLERNNIHVYKEKNIEGDDWCYYFSTKLNQENTNCIIWTKDNDLKQLVKINPNKCFTIWWNKDNGAYIEDYKEENLDFLFNLNYDDNANILDNINNNNVVNKINPHNIIIEKILRGDLSDNIFPIFLKKANAPSNKTFRISLKDIDYDLDIFDDDKVKDFINQICNNKKYKNKLTETPENIFEHFKYNRQLVTLNECEYPISVLEILNSTQQYNQQNSNIKNDIYTIESIYISQNNNLQNILNII